MTPSRIRAKGTKEFYAPTGKDIINACRIVIYDRQFAKVNDQMLDITTASAIVAVYDNLSVSAQNKMEAMPLEKMGTVAFKVLNKVKGI